MSQLSISTLHLFCTRFSFGHQLGARSELALHQHVEHSLPLLLPKIPHLLPRGGTRLCGGSFLRSLLNHLFPFCHYSRTISSAVRRPRGDVMVHGQFGSLLRRIRLVVRIPLQLGDGVHGAVERGRPWRNGESAAQDAPQATTSGDADARRVEAEIKVVSPPHLPIGAVLECLPCNFLGL
jgi:hypothetical protein